MNKDRRKQIEKIRQRLAVFLATAEDIKSDLSIIRDDEQTYRDNLPEFLSDSEKAHAADVAIGALDQVIEALDNVVDNPFDDQLTEAAA